MSEHETGAPAVADGEGLAADDCMRREVLRGCARAGMQYGYVSVHLLIEALAIIDRLAAARPVPAAPSAACANCGHPAAKHDPEDGNCETHRNDGGLGVCPCTKYAPSEPPAGETPEASAPLGCIGSHEGGGCAHPAHSHNEASAPLVGLTQEHAEAVHRAAFGKATIADRPALLDVARYIRASVGAESEGEDG